MDFNQTPQNDSENQDLKVFQYDVERFPPWFLGRLQKDVSISEIKTMAYFYGEDRNTSTGTLQTPHGTLTVSHGEYIVQDGAGNITVSKTNPKAASINASEKTTDKVPVRKKMNFGEAFEQVKQGKGMRLKDWKPDVIVRVQYPNGYSKMTAPYLYVESRYGKVPWKETMIELFSKDWEVVD